MKILKLFVLSILLVSFVSCDSNESEKTNKNSFKLVKLKGKYSLVVPKYMSKTTDLNDDASIQYEHLRKEVYVTVMNEAKKDIFSVIDDMDIDVDSTELLSFYVTAYLSPFDEELEGYQVKNTSDLKVHGLPTRIVEFDGILDGKHPISYMIGFLEGEEQFYTIALWTLAKYKAKNLDMFNKVVRSFKELK